MLLPVQTLPPSVQNEVGHLAWELAGRPTDPTVWADSVYFLITEGTLPPLYVEFGIQEDYLIEAAGKLGYLA